MVSTTQKFIIGFLTLVVLSASIYVMIPDNVRIDVGKTYSTFKVYENKSWIVSGQEYSYLYNGTKKMLADSRELNYTINGNLSTITRIANFGSTKVIDTYNFDGGTKNVELFPINHNIMVINGTGKTLVYEVTKLDYSGLTVSNVQSPQSFGHKMKVEWDIGNYFSKITKLKDSGKLTIKYRIDSNSFSKNVRLFDPVSGNVTLNTPSNNTISYNGTFNFNSTGIAPTNYIINNVSFMDNSNGVFSIRNTTLSSEGDIVNYDNFEDSSIDSNLWNTSTSSYGAITESGGSLTLSTGGLAQSGGLATVITKKDLFNLYGNNITFNINWDSYTDPSYIQFGITDGSTFRTLWVSTTDQSSIDINLKNNGTHIVMTNGLTGTVSAFEGGSNYIYFKVYKYWTGVGTNVQLSLSSIYAQGMTDTIYNHITTNSYYSGYYLWNEQYCFNDGTCQYASDNYTLYVPPINLTYPSDNYIEYYKFLISTNSTGNIPTGKYLTNVSLLDNSTGLWNRRNTTYYSYLNNINSSFVYAGATGDATTWNTNGVSDNGTTLYHRIKTSSNEGGVYKGYWWYKNNVPGASNNWEVRIDGTWLGSSEYGENIFYGFYNDTTKLLQNANGKYLGMLFPSSTQGDKANSFGGLYQDGSGNSYSICSWTSGIAGAGVGIPNDNVSLIITGNETDLLTCKLYLNGALNQTNNSLYVLPNINLSNFSYFGAYAESAGYAGRYVDGNFTYATLTDYSSSYSINNFTNNYSLGSYKWNHEYCFNDNVCYTYPLNYTFIVSTIYPSITFSSLTPSNNTYLNQTSLLNDMTIDNCTLYKNITYNIWNDTFTNSTTLNSSCIEDDSYTWILLDGNYNYNVTTFNTLNNSDTTEIRVVTIDTTFPQIDYTPNSDVTNLSADFNIKNNIFVNVSINETNEGNITFVLRNVTNSLNTTTYLVGNRTINWTNLTSNAVYFWNVTTCDLANNCNTTLERMYGNEITNLTINGDYLNISAELNSTINLSSSNTLGMVYLDILHPKYGINYTSALGTTNLQLIIDYFRKTIFNDSDTSKVLEYTSTSNNTTHEIYFKAHQYDSIDALSFNITGINNTIYPNNVFVLDINGTSIDRIYPGRLIGDLVTLNRTYFVEENDSLFYINPSYQNLYFFMDDNSKFNNFTFNITGEEFGLEFKDYFNTTTYIDDSSLDLITKQGTVSFKHSNLTNFIWDDYEDGTIDTIKNVVSPNWNVNTGDCIIDRGVSESGGNLKLDFSAACQDYSVDDYTQAYTNLTKLNLRNTEEIMFNISGAYSGDQDNLGCSGNSYIQLGGTVIWTSQQVNGRYGESASSNLAFRLEKIEGGKWRINISGVENAYSSGGFCTDGGWANYAYNWTNGSYIKTYEDCPTEAGLLNNSFLVEVNYESLYPVLFTAHQTSSPSGGEECRSMTNSLYINFINNSLYYLENGTFLSKEVYTSSGNIEKATLGYEGYAITSEDLATDSLSFFMSADNGLHWESVTDGIEHTFAYPGNNLFWKALLNTTNPGFRNTSAYIDEMNITTPKGYPSDLTFDFGNDGIIDYTFEGELNETNSPYTVVIDNANITAGLNVSSLLYNHLKPVPFEIYSATTGELYLDAFNLTSRPNPISFNLTNLRNYLGNSSGFTDVPIVIGSIGGNITINDLRYDYAGGNDTIQLIAHNADYSSNITRNITYYFSQWDYQFVPTGIDFIYFGPKKPTDTNVMPYGQTNSIPIINLTNLGYGGKNVTLALWLNDSLSCANTTLSFSNNKSLGFRVYNNWTLLANTTYLQNKSIWLWEDFACNYSNWHIANPNYYFRQTCEDCFYSEELF